MMCDFCKVARQNVRYWLFPESRLIEARTAEIDQHAEKRKALKDATDVLVKNADQADVLRHLVIAMQEKHWR